MNKNINLCKILKDFPIGTKLYSPIFGEVELEYLDYANDLIYVLYTNNEHEMKSAYFQIDGTYINSAYGETMLFPSKTQHDWSKFKVPVKKFDPKTFKPFDKVLTKGDTVWVANLFGGFVVSHKGEREIMMATGAGSIYPWEFCIPYNDETKHLLGTTDDCPEYYKWWKRISYEEGS